MPAWSSRRRITHGGGTPGPNGVDAAGNRRWRDLAADPMAQPMVVAQNYAPGGGRPNIAPPAGENICGLSTDIIRYLLSGVLPQNWPAAAPPLPAYPGEQGIRPDDGSYIIGGFLNPKHCYNMPLSWPKIRKPRGLEVGTIQHPRLLTKVTPFYEKYIRFPNQLVIVESC